MATKTISVNWKDIHSNENITKWYLYGDLEDNHNLLSKEIFRTGISNDSDSAQIILEIDDFYDFMTSEDSPMRYANLSQIPVVQEFFNEKTYLDPYPDTSGTRPLNPNALVAGEYTLEQVRQHFTSEGNKLISKSYGLEQRNYGSGFTEDFKKRVYIWNSQAIHIGDLATFVVTEDGERYIKNAAPTIASDDFDYVGSSVATLGGKLSFVPNIDPMGIFSFPRSTWECIAKL